MLAKRPRQIDISGRGHILEKQPDGIQVDACKMKRCVRPAGWRLQGKPFCTGLSLHSALPSHGFVQRPG